MRTCSQELMQIISEAKRRNPAKNFIILDEKDLRELVKFGKKMDILSEQLKRLENKQHDIM
jgi:hypothetical protein